MRVLPLENEAVNECWLADRDRFSYEALNSDERLTRPCSSRAASGSRSTGRPRSNTWPTACKQIKADHGAPAHRRAGQPAQHGGRAVPGRPAGAWPGSENIDYRLRHAEFAQAGEGVRWLGTSIASLSNLQGALVIGSNLRKDHPLFALRLRGAVRKGAGVASSMTSSRTGRCPGQPRDRAGRPVGAGAGRRGRGGRRRKGRRRRRKAMPPTPRRRSPHAAVRRTQGDPARQRCGAPRQRRRRCSRWPTGSAADRRDGGLPHRSREHARRATGRRRSRHGRPNAGADAGGA